MSPFVMISGDFQPKSQREIFVLCVWFELFSEFHLSATPAKQLRCDSFQWVNVSIKVNYKTAKRYACRGSI